MHVFFPAILSPLEAWLHLCSYLTGHFTFSIVALPHEYIYLCTPRLSKSVGGSQHLINYPALRVEADQSEKMNWCRAEHVTVNLVPLFFKPLLLSWLETKNTSLDLNSLWSFTDPLLISWNSTMLNSLSAPLSDNLIMHLCASLFNLANVIPR